VLALSPGATMRLKVGQTDSQPDSQPFSQTGRQTKSKTVNTFGRSESGEKYTPRALDYLSGDVGSSMSFLQQSCLSVSFSLFLCVFDSPVLSPLACRVALCGPLRQIVSV